MPEWRHAIQAGVVIANMLSQPGCPIDDKGEHDIVEDAADQVLHQRLSMATIRRQKSMSCQEAGLGFRVRVVVPRNVA